MRQVAWLGLALASTQAWAIDAEIEVWGDDRFAVVAPPLGVVVAPGGQVCAVDADGVSCFDADGAPTWDLDLAGWQVYDVIGGHAEMALYTERGAVIVSLETGEGELLDPGAFVAGRSDGALVVVGGQAGVPIPPGLEPIEVLAAPDDRVGLLDAGGDLTWVDLTGAPLGKVPLQLPASGGLRAVPFDGGWAVLDDRGVVLLDGGGLAYAALDHRMLDVAPAPDRLLVADGTDIFAIDLDTAEVIGVEADVPAQRIALSPDGGRLAAALPDGGRLMVWEGDTLLGGGHHAAVAVLAPGPDGVLVSSDLDGVGLRWSAQGEPTALDGTLVHAAYDGRGGLWLAWDQAVEHRVGLASRSFDLTASTLVGLPDGAVAQTDGALVRLDVEGQERWRVPAERGALIHAEGTLGLALGATGVVLDATTGARRRLLQAEGTEIRQLGVAVGGLVLAGVRDGGAIAGRPPVAQPLARVPRVTGGPWLSPNGRLALWQTGASTFELTDIAGNVLLSGQSGGRITAAALADQRVWIGRDDGRIERWTLDPRIGDAPLPAFESYAQLEAFTPLPSPSEPLSDVRVGGIQGLGTTESGDLLLHTASVAVRSADGGTRVLPLGVTARPTVARAIAGRGIVVGLSDGAVLADVQTGEPTRLGQVAGPVIDACAAGEALLVASVGGVHRLGAAGFVSAPGAPDGLPSALACDPAGRWAAAIVEGVASVWDPTTGERRATLRHAGPVTALAASAGGVLTGGADEVVILWEPSRFTAAAILDGHGAAIRVIADMPGGRQVLVGAETWVVAWDLDAGRPTRLVDLGEPVRAIAPRPQGRAVVGGAQGRLIELALTAPAPRPVPPGPLRPALPDDAPLAVPVRPAD